jgi:hypothetical protein
MATLNLLEVEERLLNHIKKVLFTTNSKCAKRDLFDGVKTTGMLRKVVSHHKVMDDSGWGHCLINYKWFLVMNYYGKTYVGTITSSYNGGSCGFCDAVEAANDSNDPSSYMKNRINALKFKTFGVSKPRQNKEKETEKEIHLNIYSMNEFPNLKH